MGQRSSHGNLESVKGRINITNLKSETNGSKQQGFTMSNLSIAQKRAAASLRCMFVGDSLAMPVHWYYNPMDIFKQLPSKTRVLLLLETQFTANGGVCRMMLEAEQLNYLMHFK